MSRSRPSVRLTASLTAVVGGGWNTDPVTSRSQTTNARRWLLPFLAAMIAALAAILLGTISSATAAAGAETRVRASDQPATVLVGSPEHITAGQSRDAAEDQPQIVVATGVAAETGEDTVSLFKASQRGLGESHYAHGYKPEDFPGNGAYFAREKEIADSYATHYGEGVIETRVPRGVYDEHFAQYEMRYLGTPPGTELAIPPHMLDFLSQFERIWH